MDARRAGEEDGAIGLLLVGLSEAAIPLDNGCLQLVDPLIKTIPFTVSPAAPPWTGHAVVDIVRPAQANPTGLYFQAMILDASSGQLTAVTGGVQLPMRWAAAPP